MRTVQEVVPDVAESVRNGFVEGVGARIAPEAVQTQVEDAERAPMTSSARVVASWAAVDAAASAMATRTEISAYSS